ncbi:hypothetical protein NL108_000591 [Boleophthalmus pectinirostris]|nr:hypothetical protein NL108_000591 [Boleophthalmus pectinirostris]
MSKYFYSDMLLFTPTVNMKLLLLSLFTVVCCVWVNATVEDQIGRHRLDELLVYLRAVKKNMQNGDNLVSTPPQDVQDHCCLTALECFGTTLHLQFNAAHVKHVRKLIRGLRSRTTEKTMSFCHSNTTLPNCQDSCNMHPKKSANEFLQKLESLIQRANTNLARV